MPTIFAASLLITHPPVVEHESIVLSKRYAPSFRPINEM
jgi:hypothetical protein